jgi:hypothetical protein
MAWQAAGKNGHMWAGLFRLAEDAPRVNRKGARTMTSSPSFRLDPSRWARTDWITGISTLVLLITLFLPWFGVDIFGINAEADGLTAHGYLYLVLIVCLVIAGYLIAVAGVEDLEAALPLSHRQRLLIGTGLNGLLVLLAFALKPTATGWRFGAFAGLLAALVALAPQVIPALAARGTVRGVGAAGDPGTRPVTGSVTGSPAGPASGSAPGPVSGPDHIAGR